MSDLHARLLAEIEWRERAERATFPPSDDDLDRYSEVLAYLAALRGVVELHTDFAGGCHECEYDYPCATLRCVAEGLGVTP